MTPLTYAATPCNGASRCATGKLRASPRFTSRPNGLNSTEDSTHRWMKDRGHVTARRLFLTQPIESFTPRSDSVFGGVQVLEFAYASKTTKNKNG